MFAAIPLAFIIPPLCYIRLEAGSLTSLAKIPAILLASFGIIVTTKGAIDIFTNVCHLTIKSRAFTLVVYFCFIFFQGAEECEAFVEMPYCFVNSTNE